MGPAGRGRRADPGERIAASGVTGDTDAERRAAYAAYLTMLGSGTVQLAVKVAHEYLNAHSLVVSAGPDRPALPAQRRPHPAGASPAGALRAAEAAAASRRAIAELLRDGETAVDSWDIFDRFPDHVEQGGQLVSLPQWHREGLRDLCLELFGRRSTRAVRASCPAPSGSGCYPSATPSSNAGSPVSAWAGRGLQLTGLNCGWVSWQITYVLHDPGVF